MTFQKVMGIQGISLKIRTKNIKIHKTLEKYPGFLGRKCMARPAKLRFAYQKGFNGEGAFFAFRRGGLQLP